MNAPQTAAQLERPVITMLALGALTPSSTHIQELRRARFDQKLIQELAESIKAVGVLQPILARRSQASGRADRFEIVAGERRWLGAKKAGLAEIPATVRDLSDEQVLEVQLIENLQREGLHELEEAEGYEELMKLKKIGADVVAEMVGRSKGYVYARVKLLALCPEARKTFYAGTLNASEALLIARIPHQDLQMKAMKDLAEQKQWGDVSNFKDAQRFIHEHYMLQLKAAPFKLDDANLVPKAGTCSACPKRTGNQKDLFGDVKSGDVCTDPKCFAEKRAAGEAKLIAEHKAKGVEVIVGEPAQRIFPYSENNASSGYHLLSDQCWDDPKRRKYSQLVGDKDVKLVQSPHSGKLIKVVHSSAVPAVKAARKKAAAQRKKTVGGPDENAVNARILKAIHEKCPSELPKALVEQLVCDLAINAENLLYGEASEALENILKDLWGFKSTLTIAGYNKLPKEVQALDAKKLAKLAIEIVALVDLYEGGNVSRRAMLICQALKIDPKKIEKQVAEEAKAAAKAGEKGKAKAKKK